jgi:putative DNA primase/helicase
MDAGSSIHRTDLGNARRLVLQHGENLRYAQPSRTWHVWDGRRWREDRTGEVTRRAKATVINIYAEAAALPDEKSRRELVAHAVRSEAEARIRAMITLAESEPEVVVEPEQLDANPLLLTCMNGTLDLRTGNLRPHRREDLITLLAPVEFDADAQHDLWDQTITFAFPDREVQDFVRRAVGYSATGDGREEKLFMLIGPTASGKTTFVEATKAALGEYAATADIRSFLASRDDRGPRNDIARLAGRRFIPSVEVDQGRRLAEGVVKLLSGGDTVVARRLYQEHIEFRFAGKIWIVANHAPTVRDDDDALWRRIIRIPCHQIPEDRRDKTVKDLLRNPSVGGPAVLAWIVRGCLDWQRRGLDTPLAVATETEAYRQEMDALQPFIESACRLDSPAWTDAKTLREAYESWCRENGERPIAGRAWGQRLRDHGCHPEKHAARGWAGIALKDGTEQTD